MGHKMQISDGFLLTLIALRRGYKTDDGRANSRSTGNEEGFLPGPDSSLKENESGISLRPSLNLNLYCLSPTLRLPSPLCPSRGRGKSNQCIALTFFENYISDPIVHWKTKSAKSYL